MTRPRCRQRGALRAALFLLPRAFYRHPLLIAVVPHRLGRESIYHHQHHHNHHHHHHHRHHYHIATLHRRNPFVYARGVSALKSATDCTNFSLAARARFENASGFGPAANSRAKLVSCTLHKLFMERHKRYCLQNTKSFRFVLNFTTRTLFMSIFILLMCLTYFYFLLILAYILFGK